MEHILIASPFDMPAAETVVVREIHGQRVKITFEKISFDAACTLANFVDEHPDHFVYAVATYDQYCRAMERTQTVFGAFFYSDTDELVLACRAFGRFMTFSTSEGDVEKFTYFMKPVWPSENSNAEAVQKVRNWPISTAN